MASNVIVKRTNRSARLCFNDVDERQLSFLRNGSVITAGVYMAYYDTVVELSVVNSQGHIATGNITMTTEQFAEMCRTFLEDYDESVEKES